MSFTPPTQPGTRYRVYMTPLTDIHTYGAEVEVTDHITLGGINQIKRAIDSQDYSIGVYFYSDLELIGSNDNGYFGEMDARSIFSFYRDRTKVRVVFENASGDQITFRGLISEEATRLDVIAEKITFRVLSRDSVIRNTNVAGGAVPNGSTVKTAILNILADTTISSVLTATPGNINPNLNFVIDLGTAFDDKPTQSVLNELLLASNSIMTIDDSGNIFIKSRAENSAAVLNLFGPYNIQNRQNVIGMTNYNNGRQRMFTSVEVVNADGVSIFETDATLSSTYGVRQTSMTFDWLTNTNTQTDIAKGLLKQFAVPKIELEVEVSTALAKTVDLNDRVSIDWPLRVTPYQGHMMPVIGTATIGNAKLPLPVTTGTIAIAPILAFKVLEIDEDPSTFTSILKLRQIGSTLDDGYFNTPASSIVGYAIIGAAPIGGTDDPAETWNPSAVGAARVGSTKVA